jgi:hypothetical protein
MFSSHGQVVGRGYGSLPWHRSKRDRSRVPPGARPTPPDRCPAKHRSRIARQRSAQAACGC